MINTDPNLAADVKELYLDADGSVYPNITQVADNLPSYNAVAGSAA
jgi:hypothetical protein